MEGIVAVDTNILVRLITCDDEIRYQQSLSIFQNRIIYIPNTVILETEWVLRFVYKFGSTDIAQAFRNVFGLTNVILTDESSIFLTIKWYEKGMDFGDALHLAVSQNCSELYTFDAKYIKKAKALTNFKVLHPKSLEVD